MTIQQPDLMGADEARQVTNGIRLALDRVSTAWADLAERISDAYQRRADLALGYGSWADYAEAELRPSHELAADIRRELVGLLSAQGMSTRAIAPTVGVTHKTIVKDRQVVPEVPPAPSGSTVATTGGVIIAQAERIDLATGEVLDHLADASNKVTGLDGKTYTRPEPKQRRTPLPEAIWTTVYDVARKVERLERLIADDRLPQNRDKVAMRNHSDLVRIIDALQRVADQINPNQE